MSLILKTGNMFDSTADAYAQGVNTEGLMGAGIAVAFKRAYPEMYKNYKLWCKNGWLQPGGLQVWDDQSNLPIIYNLASQDEPGSHAKLEWFESALKTMITDAELCGVKKVAMPRIGCGIGGLEWEDVLDIIEHYAAKTEVEIEVWTL